MPAASSFSDHKTGHMQRQAGDLELMLPVAEALVQGLQLGVRVHAGGCRLLLLHLPDERQVIIKQPPLAVELLLHQPTATLQQTKAERCPSRA